MFKLKNTVSCVFFAKEIDVHMSDNGHFRPFLDTFRIPLGKLELLLYLAVLNTSKIRL